MILGIYPFLALVIFSCNSNTDAGKIVGYFSNWAIYRPDIGKFTSSDIRVNDYTHLIYAFVGINSTTSSVLVLDPDVDIKQEGFKNFTNLKHKNPQVTFMVSIGGWGEGGKKFSELVSCTKNREKFIESVIEFLKVHNFEGLSVDWEYPGDCDRDGQPTDFLNFGYLIKELRYAFDKENKAWQLTIAVPLSEEKLKQGYDVPTLCNFTDAIHVMAYDLRKNEDGFVGVHTPLYRNISNPKTPYSVAEGMQLWVSLGCPSQKLVMGTAFYGRTFTLRDENIHGVDSPIKEGSKGGLPGPYTQSVGFLAYYEICMNLCKHNWTEMWDPVGLCPYMFKGDQWVGYENIKSLSLKLDYIKNKDYAGAMVWAVDMDDFHGACGPRYPLTELVYNSIEYSPSS